MLGSRKSVSCDRDGPYYSTLNRPGRSPSTRSTPCRSTSRRTTPGRSTSGRSTSVCSRSTADRSTTPEAPPVPPATYHWEEVRRKRSVGGYPWTHLNKPPFDEKTWVKYERQVCTVCRRQSRRRRSVNKVRLQLMVLMENK